jgi:hypothetical protein
MKMLATFPTMFFHSIISVLENIGFVVKERRLFRRDAITAPRKPTHNVKCCTKTGEATMPVELNILEITSMAGNDTKVIKTKKVKI